MREETCFLVYCMERYRLAKGLTSQETAELFDEYDLYHYVTKYFASLHTLGDKTIVQELDDQIASLKG